MNELRETITNTLHAYAESGGCDPEDAADAVLAALTPEALRGLFIERPELFVDMAASDYDQVQRLGIDKFKDPSVGKHLAVHDDHLRNLMSRLTLAGDTEAVDTIVWLIWYRQLEANWKLYFTRKLLKAKDALQSPPKESV